MKVAIFAFVCLVPVPVVVQAQELRAAPLDAAELAAKLNIYIQKFQVEFTEPVFAKVLLREENAVSSFQTTRPAKVFVISFEAIPSELAVEKPKQISFRANVTGTDTGQGTFASANRSVVPDPRFSRESFSVASPYFLKFVKGSGNEAKVTHLPLDAEICLFEYQLDGKIEKAPKLIKIQGCVTFSAKPNTP
jgi:hypothetical protein